MGYQMAEIGSPLPDRPIIERNVEANRLLPLGFGSTNIAATGTATLLLRPAAPYRPVRIVFAGTADEDLRMTDFKINGVSQFVGTGALPARAFSPEAMLPDLGLATGQPGIDIEVVLASDSASQITVKGMLLGYSAKLT